jgi:nitrite reductase/ring-hydroxylating ferredoxin subunit
VGEAEPLGTPGRHQRVSIANGQWVLPVSLERVHENALDWQRLPHVHHTLYRAVRCLDAGSWGWRAMLQHAVGAERSVVELRLERFQGLCTVRVLQGRHAGLEVRGMLNPQGPQRTRVSLEFFVAGAVALRRRRIGRALAHRYGRLLAIDAEMMVERQRQIDCRVDRARDADRSLVLGARDALSLPMEVTLAGRGYLLMEVSGALHAIPRRCPHQLGPLGRAGVDGRVVRCPWHGDRFDVRTGDNLSGRSCRLSHLPVVEVRADGTVVMTATH